MSIDQLIRKNACVIRALAEGLTIKQITNPRATAQLAGMKIMRTAYRYGPRSYQVKNAIDEANRLSVIATSARAAINRIKRNN